MTEHEQSLRIRLERGEIISFSPCEFALPAGESLDFLRDQRLSGSSHKNISYDPAGDSVSGYVHHSEAHAERLCSLMREFSRSVRTWLSSMLPSYASAWSADRASLRTEEEATRKLRVTARNDLLHFDAFPSRPTGGRRILRYYVNIDPQDDRVWMTSDTFAKVLHKYGEVVGLPKEHLPTWTRRLSQGVIKLFQPMEAERTEYDEFMLRLHHFLKTNDEFQDHAPRRLWHFKPGAAWLLFSDAVSHAELRGRYALEHSFFVSPESLALPGESPSALLQRFCGAGVLPAAA